MEDLPKSFDALSVNASAGGLKMELRRLTPYIGFCVKRLRVASGLTQDELAHYSRVSRSTICDLENGKRTNIGVENIEDLAHRLGVTINMLFSMADQMSQMDAVVANTDVLIG